MRIAVLGAGGVGGYFGARLSAAGEDVVFVARGRHLAALREGGLRVESELGDLTLRPVAATDDPGSIGPVDLVLFAVKLWDTEAAARAAAPLLAGGGAIATFQNGVESVETLGRILGPGRVVGGVAHIAATIGGPGLIRHTGTMARLTFGEPDGRRSERVEALFAACQRAGIDAVASDRIAAAIWEKFVFLSAFSGVTALLRRPIGPIRADRRTRALLLDAIAETAALAGALGIDLPADIVERLEGFADGLPAVMKASMLHDLERGGRLELPWLSGAVARLAERNGVPAPIHRVIAAALALDQDGAG